MKRRMLSLALVLCLCLSLIPFAALTAFADDGVAVWVNGKELALDGYSHPLGNGIGAAAAGVSGNKLTVTLSNAKIGTTKEVEEKNCGVYISITKGQELDIILDGATECYGDFYVERQGSSTGEISFVPGYNNDSSLTVHGQTCIFWAAYINIGAVQLNLTADQSNDAFAFEARSNVIIGTPTVKGGGDITSPEVTIGTEQLSNDRPVGMYAYSLTVNDGNLSVYGNMLGAFLQPNHPDITGFVVNGGYSSFTGGEAGILIEDCDLETFGGDPYSFAAGYGEKHGYNSGKSDPTEPEYNYYEDATYSYYTWVAEGDAITNILPYISFASYDWYSLQLEGAVAGSVEFGALSSVEVVYDCGTFGAIDGESYYFAPQAMPGDVIGLLPVPVNTTFTSGTFNNMYFEGWQVKGQYEGVIDETYTVPNHALELEAVWSEGQTSMSFKDVKSSDWFYEAVKYCYGQNLISGTDSKSFSPKMNCSRAMIVTILYRLDGSCKTYGSNPFSDVKAGQWYTDAVLWAAENGIVAGDGKGHFSPNADVTREQLAQIMRSYATYCGRYNPEVGVMLAGFPDEGKVSGWAGDSVSWAVAMELISGKPQNGQNYLDPQGKASRAEFASILLRYIKAFTGDCSYYIGELLTVNVPAMWNGNVVCRYNKDSGSLSFYAKKTYEASEGLAGRLFWLELRGKDDNYLADPNFETICGYLKNDSELCYYVCAFEPTDVQCEYPYWQPEGAQYSSMFEGYNDFTFDSAVYHFSKGVG